MARILQTLPLLVVAALASAGCLLGPSESQGDAGDDVNNANQANGDRTGDAAEPAGGGCISTTTGEATTDESANPCPTGQYPSSG